MTVCASVTDNAKLRAIRTVAATRTITVRMYAKEAASHVGFAFPRPAVPDLNGTDGSDDARCTDTAVIPLPPQISHDSRAATALQRVFRRSIYSATGAVNGTAGWQQQ